MTADHDDVNQESDEQRRDITGPDAPTGEATRPPANPPRDEEATSTAEDKLDQAGGGH